MEKTATVQPAASSNYKWLYIGGGALVLIGLVYFVFRSGIPAAVAPAGVNVDRNIDGSTTYSNAEGSVMVGQNAQMPNNWPSDAPGPYAGATLLYSGMTNPSTGAVGSAIAYTVKASMDQVVAHYTTQLGANGWSVQSNAEMAGMRAIVAKKDTRTLGIYLGDAGNGIVNVTAGMEF